jgi:hypothetical protein
MADIPVVHKLILFWSWSGVETWVTDQTEEIGDRVTFLSKDMGDSRGRGGFLAPEGRVAPATKTIESACHSSNGAPVAFGGGHGVATRHLSSCSA